MIVIALVLLVLVTQVLNPLLSDTIMFPIFRRKRTVLMNEIVETKAQLGDADLESSLAALKEQLKNKQETK